MVLGGAASAQHALHCRDLDPRAPQDAIRAFECVSKLDDELTEALSRLDTLEQTLSQLSASVTQTNAVPAKGEHENTRAIVAYYSDKGEKRCPAGWSPFEEAKERFIVGASAEGLYPVVGSIGGEAEVTLTEPQMPRHSHPLKKEYGWDVNGNGGAWRIDSGDGAPWGDRKGVLDTHERGGDQPHNNIPPYIALYFCKQD